MQSERAREIYKTRAQVAETPNLWIKAKFGLRQFSVRGLAKVGMEALWACLTYNIRVWIRLRWRQAAAWRSLRRERGEKGRVAGKIGEF